MQDVLNVTDRVVSTSNATTSPCGQLLTLCNQTAPSDEQLSGTVDTSAMAVIAPTAHTDSQVLAFSADQATGASCLTVLLLRSACCWAPLPETEGSSLLFEGCNASLYSALEHSCSEHQVSSGRLSCCQSAYAVAPAAGQHAYVEQGPQWQPAAQAVQCT